MVKGLSRFAIKHGLIPVVYAIIRLYFCLIRIRSVDEEGFRNHLAQGGKAIVAIWHQRILIVLEYARPFGEFAPAVMISQSRDGELIADVYRRLNFRPVRGSSFARRPEGPRCDGRGPCGTPLRRPRRGRPARPPGRSSRPASSAWPSSRVYRSFRLPSPSIAPGS